MENNLLQNVAMPENIAAEESALASMLQDPAIAAQGLCELQPGDFAGMHSRELFLCMLEAGQSGKPVNLVTVCGLYQDRQYVIQLINGLGGPGIYESAIAELRECRQRREFIINSAAAIRAAEIGEPDFLSRGEDAVNEARSIGSDKAEPVGQAAIEAVTGMARNDAGVMTGFPDLDKINNGLHGGELITLANRPGGGKTTLGCNMAVNVALRGGSAAVFSMEMDKRKILQRMAASLAKVTLDAARGKADAASKIVDAAAQLAEVRLFVDDRARLSAEQIAAKCHRIQQDKGLDLVVIDYLGLMRANEARGKTREREIAELTGKLKCLARTLNVPILLLSQMNRAIEGRVNEKPRLSDLRESGAIEQDSDMVLFIHNINAANDEPNSKLIIAKNRNGTTGAVNLFWRREWFLFQTPEWRDMAGPVPFEDIPRLDAAAGE